MSMLSSFTKIFKKKSELINLFFIKKSEYFDKKWYLNTYPDVKKAKIDPALHYLLYGWKEFRDPGPWFSTKQYLMQNKDIENKGINPLLHFEKHGKKEKRKIFCSKNIFINNYEMLSQNEKHIYNIINDSLLFNKNWYSTYYKLNNEDPALHYIKHYVTHNPSPVFYSNEYYIIYPDIKKAKMNPLVHYEKHGKYEGRVVSLADIREYIAPNDTIEITQEINKRERFDKKIVTVLACFSSNAKIEDYQLYLLNGLKKISDYIIIVSDNPVYEAELTKLDGICNAYKFIRHGEYDFGSYKRGYEYLVNNNILNDDDNLLFINDSNYGPVYSFENVIDDFKSKQCDFYGLSCGRDNKIIYIQSFFYIFTSKVYTSTAFKAFMNNICKQLSVNLVVLEYEYKLTQYLVDAGFCYETYVQNDEFLPHLKYVVPTKYINTLLKKYKYPLIKSKVIQGNTIENQKDAINMIKQINTELYNIIINSKDYEKITKVKDIYIPSKYNIYSNYNNKLKEINAKYKSGNKINIHFLVSMLSMFSAENLMLLMKNSDIYNVKLYVIPDVRLNNEEMYKMYNDTYSKLKSKYNYVEHSIIINEKKEILEYKNIIKDADIVCYPSPFDISFSLYNPYYAVQENVLSIYLNNDFTSSNKDLIKYRIDNYNNFWKVFLETEINYNEYRLYGQCEAKNSVVTGYAKLDKLQSYMKNKKDNQRKKIIIALQGSASENVNKAQSLSNFEKYADLFIEFPKKYPEIDFILRIHPVLLAKLKCPDYWGEERIVKYIEKFMSYNNGIYSIDDEYLELFANSDGIISDNESFLVEYIYTGKPYCYMLSSERDIEDKFNGLGIKCIEQNYVAYNEHEIMKFIEDVIIKENDYKQSLRIKFLQQEILLDNSDTINQIYKYIIEKIQYEEDKI